MRRKDLECLKNWITAVRALARSNVCLWRMGKSERKILCMINDHWSMCFCTHFVFNSTSFDNCYSLACKSNDDCFFFLASSFHISFFLSCRTHSINSFPKLVCWRRKKHMERQNHDVWASEKERTDWVARFYWKMKKKKQSDWHSFQAQVVQKKGKNHNSKIRIQCCFENATVSPEK